MLACIARRIYARRIYGWKKKTRTRVPSLETRKSREKKAITSQVAAKSPSEAIFPWCWPRVAPGVSIELPGFPPVRC